MRKKILITFVFMVILFSTFLYYLSNSDSEIIVVHSVSLVDADLNKIITEELPNCSIINMTSLSVDNISLIANTEPQTIGSVVFKLNNTLIKVENTHPYAFFGDDPPNDYLPWNPDVGSYNLTVIPYSEKDAEGEMGEPYVLLFKIIKKAPKENIPLIGQIVVDPYNNAWLVKYQEGPFFLCGPGDPEDFLYRGILNPDGTRTGDQLELIDKLKGTGANSIYLQAIRSHGGDGEETHNPFIDNDPGKGLNNNTLDQWEEWFSEMDEDNIVIYFFLYDDGAIVWDTGDDVLEAEESFIKNMVDRFEHHKNLIWVVTEEFEGRYSELRISRIASKIREADDFNHVIAVHHSSEQEMAFPDDPNIDQYAIQYYWPHNERDEYTREELHDKVLEAWRKAENRYNLNMAESENWGTGEKARKKSWAIAMAGSYSMILGMDIENTPISDLEDCGRLVNFMENTEFNTMSPMDELGFRGTEYLLANPGICYIAYSSLSNGTIGVRNLPRGHYNFTWYDIPSGMTINTEKQYRTNGDRFWEKPPGISDEIAIYIKKIDDIEIIYPQTTWMQKSPDEMGLDSSKLDQLEILVGGNGLVIKDGFIVKTWGEPDIVYYWASSSKPVLSTMLFFAIQEGRIESVDSYVQDWDWNLKEKDENMTFRHLANMVSGYARPEKPGEAYAYNDRAIQLYFLTLERIFTQDINEAAMERLQSQINLEGNMIFSERGRILLSLNDFARICWLWINNGNWDGTQVLEERFFKEYMKPGVITTTPYAPFDHYSDDYLNIGTYGAFDTSRNNSAGVGIYGFNWWFNSHGILMNNNTFELTWPDAPPDTFMTRGKGDAHSVMIPSEGIVMVATNSDWGSVFEIQQGLKSTNYIIKTLVDSIIE